MLVSQLLLCKQNFIQDSILEQCSYVNKMEAHERSVWESIANLRRGLRLGHIYRAGLVTPKLVYLL